VRYGMRQYLSGALLDGDLSELLRSESAPVYFHAAS
jgi:hypothetical protein